MTTYETNESDLTSDDAKIGDLKDDEKIVMPLQTEDFDREIEATQNLDNEIHGSDKNHTDDENTNFVQKLELDTVEPVSASPEVTQDVDASVELQYDSEVNEESPEVTIDYLDVNNDPENNKMESNDKNEACDNSMKIEKVNDEAEIIENINTLVNDDSGSACQESIDFNDSAIDKDHSEASIDPISTNHELEIVGLKTDDQKLDELNQASIENDEEKSLVDCIKSPDLFAPKVSNFEEFEEVKSPEMLTFEEQEIDLSNEQQTALPLNEQKNLLISSSAQEQKVVTPIIQETDIKTLESQVSEPDRPDLTEISNETEKAKVLSDTEITLVTRKAIENEDTPSAQVQVTDKELDCEIKKSEVDKSEIQNVAATENEKGEISTPLEETKTLTLETIKLKSEETGSEILEEQISTFEVKNTTDLDSQVEESSICMSAQEADDETILDVPDLTESIYITPFDTPKDEQSLTDDLIADKYELESHEIKAGIVSSDSIAHMDSATSSGDTTSRHDSYFYKI